MLLRIGREGGLSIADLPPEILRLIFAHLKWNGSDPETPTFFSHAWRAYVRSIKSLVLVCKLWCTLTTPILYSFVYLRDVGQLSALVRTLQEDRLAQLSLQKRHDCWIKHLYIMFYIPPSWYEVCRSDLLRLFVSCSASVQTIVHEPNLQYQICRDFSFFKIIESKLLQYPLPDPRTLRVDILTPARCLSDICSHSLFPALRELRLDISLPAHHILARKITEKVILPRLEVLVCDVSEAEEFENVEILIKYCFLPKLQTLRVRACIKPKFEDYSCPDVETLIRVMQKLCASYGTSLTTLTLDFGSCASPRRQAMDWIFTQCPRLELLECSDHVAPSLIRSAVEKLSSDKRPVHTSLRRIGLLASVEFDFDATTPELSTAFPALDAIVVHDYSLLAIPDPFTGIENIVLLRHNLHDWIAVARDKGVRLLDYEDRNISIVDDVSGLDVDNIEDDPDYGSGSECSFAYGTDNEGNYVYETDSYDENYYSEGPDSDSEEDWNGEHMMRELAPEPSNAEQSDVGREEAQRIYTSWLELGADGQMVDTDSDSDASAA